MSVPFDLQRPTPSAPLLFCSPHSGRDYPDDFAHACTRAQLRQAEDAYVDHLLGAAPAHGVTCLSARFPRSYIDPNRDAHDIDPALLDDDEATGWAEALRPSDKSALGVGLIRRVVVPGVPIYARKLRRAEIERRIAHYHRPYLIALAESIAALRHAHGRLRVIDWHSMKARGNAATPDGPVARPDFVLGDRHGRACATRFTATVGDFLTARGYTVAVNEPYAGAHILARFGDPAGGVHALQVEINRALYLDEATVTPHDGLGTLRALVGDLAAHLVGETQE